MTAFLAPTRSLAGLRPVSSSFPTYFGLLIPYMENNQRTCTNNWATRRWMECHVSHIIYRTWNFIEKTALLTCNKLKDPASSELAVHEAISAIGTISSLYFLTELLHNLRHNYHLNMSLFVAVGKNMLNDYHLFHIFKSTIDGFFCHRKNPDLHSEILGIGLLSHLWRTEWDEVDP